MVLAIFNGSIGYAIRRKQQALRHAYIERAENLIEDEAKVDARLLLDRLSARSDEPLWEIESARRIVEVVDYVSQVHSFVLSDPLMTRPSVPAPSKGARLEDCA
jgi:hypothetical protein